MAVQAHLIRECSNRGRWRMGAKWQCARRTGASASRWESGRRAKASHHLRPESRGRRP